MVPILSLNVRQIVPDSRLPQPNYARTGFYLFACRDVFFHAGEQKEIPTGIKFIFPDGYFGLIVTKTRIFGDEVDVITSMVDSSVHAVVSVLARNNTNEPKRILKNSCIAMLMIFPVVDIEVRLVQADNVMD